MRESIIAV